MPKCAIKDIDASISSDLTATIQAAITELGTILEMMESEDSPSPVNLPSKVSDLEDLKDTYLRMQGKIESTISQIRGVGMELGQLHRKVIDIQEEIRLAASKPDAEKTRIEKFSDWVGRSRAIEKSRVEASSKLTMQMSKTEERFEELEAELTNLKEELESNNFPEHIRLTELDISDTRSKIDLLHRAMSRKEAVLSGIEADKDSYLVFEIPGVDTTELHPSKFSNANDYKELVKLIMIKLDEHYAENPDFHDVYSEVYSTVEGIKTYLSNSDLESDEIVIESQQFVFSQREIELLKIALGADFDLDLPSKSLSARAFAVSGSYEGSDDGTLSVGSTDMSAASSMSASVRSSSSASASPSDLEDYTGISEPEHSEDDAKPAKPKSS